MHVNVNDDWMNSTLWVQDASLVEPALLTLKVKVFLLKEGPQSMSYEDFRGRTVTQETIEWDAASWQDWVTNLPREVNRAWSNRLWLEPNRAWRTNVRDQRIDGPTANSIRLRLSIDCTVPRSAAHVVIRSYRLPEPSDENRQPFWRSNMEGPFSDSSRRCSLRGGETFGNMDNRDLIPKPLGQLAAVHEFGHYIGLHYVNAEACRSDPNSEDAYGVTDHQRNDMMGHGTRIEPWHAFPWCQRLRRHLGGPQPQTDDWVRRNPLTYATGTGDNQVLWYPRIGQIRPTVWFNQELTLDV